MGADILRVRSPRRSATPDLCFNQHRSINLFIAAGAALANLILEQCGLKWVVKRRRGPKAEPNGWKRRSGKRSHLRKKLISAKLAAARPVRPLIYYILVSASLCLGTVSHYAAAP